MVMLVALLEGCASANSESAAGRKQVRMEQSMRMGAVEDARDVRLGAKSGVGATIGSIAGSTEEGVTGKPGLEVTVKLDSGAVVAVVQEARERFRVGDRVRILSGNGESRVTH
ncbi:MAG: hypothetical protein HY067_12560 [Betaproteobacteria bacterium]|nr:hypothetical protein [Betaproteobacteria bacterium]